MSIPIVLILFNSGGSRIAAGGFDIDGGLVTTPNWKCGSMTNNDDAYYSNPSFTGDNNWDSPIEVTSLNTWWQKTNSKIQIMTQTHGWAKQKIMKKTKNA